MAGENMVFRRTASQKGRNVFVTPQNSPLRYLSCARTVLDQEVSGAAVETGGQEAGLICLHGSGMVEAAGKRYEMKPYDTLYLPPGTEYRIRTAGFFDLTECMAPSDRSGEPVFIPFEKVKSDPKLAVEAGKENDRRRIFKLIDTNVPAARLLAGVTFGEPGNWTSWVPHEHEKSKEEVYLFIDMPAPSYGVQLVYDGAGELDLAVRVQQDDAVAIHRGYHPNVGVPGHGINFVWMMAAFNPETDRDWTDMHFQEGF